MIIQRGDFHRAIAVLLSSMALGAFSGCSSSGDARASAPSLRPMAPVRSASSLDFLDALESTPTASADDVLRALAISMGIEPPAEYAPLRQRAAGLAWIDADFPTTGTTVVTAAKAADAIARAGALQRPAGPNTALPAMAAEGWLSKASAAKATLSGADVLGAVSAAADYKAARATGKPVSPKPLVMRPPSKFIPPVTKSAAPSQAEIARAGVNEPWPPITTPSPQERPAATSEIKPVATAAAAPAATAAAAATATATTTPSAPRESFDDAPPAPPSAAKPAAPAAPSTAKRPVLDTTELTGGKFPKPRPEPLPQLPRHGGSIEGGDSQ